MSVAVFSSNDNTLMPRCPVSLILRLVQPKLNYLQRLWFLFLKFQFTNVLAYNMSKAAVNQFTQSVAMGMFICVKFSIPNLNHISCFSYTELASKHVRVNAVKYVKPLTFKVEFYSYRILLFSFFSPGVIITELQKRGGMSTDIYRKVNI